MRAFSACILFIGAIQFAAGNARAVHLDGRLDYLASRPDKSADVFSGSIRFVDAPTATDFARLRKLGIEFHDFGSGPAGSRTVFPARIPFDALPTLSTLPGLAAVDCAWHPCSLPPLVVSRPQIEAEQAWDVASPLGGTLSGAGVLVCDVDTGVNYYHAHHFSLSGETYDFLDVDFSNGLSPGDAVDLDRDGLADPNELLAYHEAANLLTYGNNPAVFDPGLDFLYNDANGNGMRDYGPPTYGEDDPSYGELIFAFEDVNANGRVDRLDRLHGLGASKIRAIMNRDGTVYRRGVDLLQSEGDDWGHGTQVTSIMGGAWKGLSRMAGIAPGIETLHVDYEFYDEPPFLIPIEAGVAWAIAEGADILLIEDGEWVWEYLDGSSNLEIMLNEFAEAGGIVITPTGNLASGHQHASFASAGGQTLQVDPAYTIVWPCFLWTEPVSQGLQVTPPGGAPVPVPLDGTTLLSQGYRIYSNLSISPRGTRRIDLRLASQQLGHDVGGAWAFSFTGDDVPMHAFYGDDSFSWSTDSRWLVGEDPTHTVTWPATADSGICVAAYNPSLDAEIQAYSGTGPRIDGVPDVDIAAPGSIVFSSSPWSDMDYTWFGGTSSAGPHVAGAAALLKELIPDLDNGACRKMLREGAGRDAYTTDPDRAGAGKLRIQAAISSLLADAVTTPSHPGLALQAVPNPFNPSTTILFEAPGAGAAQIRIFDVAGREVWNGVVQADRPGPTGLQWDGRDAAGRALASGVYFAHVRQGGVHAVCKLTMVR